MVPNREKRLIYVIWYFLVYSFAVARSALEVFFFVNNLYLNKYQV